MQQLNGKLLMFMIKQKYIRQTCKITFILQVSYIYKGISKSY